ncbi:MAG: ribonuclease P protein component [Eubacteriales bacterium]|nr:ribonuclease P protein component [Eubacteriales bacterium]
MNKITTLKKNSDFRRLYSKGKSYANPYLVLYCRRSPSPVGRVGYTVSVKLGHAVVRNRVRRRLREIYRLNRPALKNGWDIIVVARSRCVKARYEKLNSAFLDACGQLNLLRGEES